MRIIERKRRGLLPVSVARGVCILMACGIGLTTRAGANESEQLEQAIEGELEGRAYRWVEVSVEGSVGILEGRVPDMWARHEAVRQAQRVEGVAEIRDLLVVPAEESDTVVAEAVAKAIRRYPHYTLWDHVTGRVVDGVVFLEGFVTPDRRKARALFERGRAGEGCTRY